MLDGSSVGSGAQITLFIELDQHVVEAIATTSAGETRNRSTVIEIVDTTVPVINTTFFDSKTGTIITSVKHKANIEVSIDVSDDCDPAPTSISGLGLSVQSHDVVSVKSNKNDSSITLTTAPDADSVVLNVIATDEAGNVSGKTAVLPVTP